MMSAYLLTGILLGQAYGTWPYWGGDLKNTSLQLMTGAMTTGPVVKYKYNTGGLVEWQFSGIGDVNGDGHMDIVMGSFDSTLYCLRAYDGVVQWYYESPGAIGISPAIGDVNGDGKAEVISQSYGRVYCLRGSNGTPLWVNLYGQNSPPKIADVNGDGAMEVITGRYCMRGSDGTLVWTGNYYVNESGPAIADVNGDGALEVVIGSSDYNIYCVSGSNGTTIWTYPTGSVVRSTPAIADVDGNGTMEIIVGSEDSKVYCLRGSNGTLLWSYTTGGRIRASSASTADVNKDGILDAVIGSDDGYIYCLRGTDGALLWRAYVANPHLPGTLVDVDSDSFLEYLASNGSTDTLYCINAESGTFQWKARLPDGEDIHCPFAGDVDADGCIEIVIGTLGLNAIWVLDDPGNASGCQALQTEEDLMSSQIDFRLHGSAIYLFMPTSSQVSISLYDASGKLIQNLYNGVLNQGTHTFNPGRGAKGVCFAVLRYQGETKVLKVIK